MPRTGPSRRFTLLLPENVDTALEHVSTALGLDGSSTIRFLIMQKAREMGFEPSTRSDSPEPAAPIEAVKRPRSRGKRKR